MKKILTSLGLTFLIINYALSAPSNTISIPNSFSSGTTISSADVNENFTEEQTKFNAHTHNDITQTGTVTSGTWSATAVGVAYGGTGSTSASAARTALGLGNAATQSTLLIANGGTGAITATLATNALLPSQTANSGKYLTTNATDTSWSKVGIVNAWASVSYSGSTPTLEDSLNVSGITDTDTGKITVTWDTDFASVNYAVVASSKQAAGEQSLSYFNTVAAGSVLIYIANAGGNLTDPANSYCIAIGD